MPEIGEMYELKKCVWLIQINGLLWAQNMTDIINKMFWNLQEKDYLLITSNRVHEGQHTWFCIL